MRAIFFTQFLHISALLSRHLQRSDTGMSLNHTSIIQVTTYGKTLRLNLVLCVVQKFWCQLPEDGVIIKPKHVGSMYKIVRILHFWGLQKFFSLCLCFSLNVTDQVSHPYTTKTTRSKIIFLYVLIFIFLDKRLKIKDSAPNDYKHSLSTICS
jgi:hypothetical protein